MICPWITLCTSMTTLFIVFGASNAWSIVTRSLLVRLDCPKHGWNAQCDASYSNFQSTSFLPVENILYLLGHHLLLYLQIRRSVYFGQDVLSEKNGTLFAFRTSVAGTTVNYCGMSARRGSRSWDISTCLPHTYLISLTLTLKDRRLRPQISELFEVPNRASDLHLLEIQISPFNDFRATITYVIEEVRYGKIRGIIIIRFIAESSSLYLCFLFVLSDHLLIMTNTVMNGLESLADYRGHVLGRWAR